MKRNKREPNLPLIPGDDVRHELPDLVGEEVDAQHFGMADQRHSKRLLRMFLVLALLNTVLFVAAAWFFYERTRHDLEGRITALQNSSAADPGTPLSTTTAREVKDIEERFSRQVSELKAELSPARQQADEAAKKVTDLEQRAEQSARRIADLAAQVSSIKPSVPPTSKPAASADISALPPAQAELVILKERNRLTSYADEAIATGARAPYERLWDSLDDPNLANLAHATRAEILRVQDCFLSGQRVKFHGIQQYQIPVAEVFPDSSVLTPAQLNDDQMIQLLLDQKLAWQTRVKAAWFLGQRRSTKVGDALVKAIKEDPVLDVIAEATFSFEQMTGYRAKLFEVKPLESWWQTYNISREEAVKNSEPPVKKK